MPSSPAEVTCTFPEGLQPACSPLQEPVNHRALWLLPFLSSSQLPNSFLALLPNHHLQVKRYFLVCFSRNSDPDTIFLVFLHNSSERDILKLTENLKVNPEDSMLQKLF